MKLTQFNTRIFVQELKDLNELIEKVTGQADTWLTAQERRESLRPLSQWEMQSIRVALENQLNELREKLATVYDFQGDRGMADFVPAGFNSNNGEEDETQDGEDPFQPYFFPGGKVNMLQEFFTKNYHVDRTYFSRNHE